MQLKHKDLVKFIKVSASNKASVLVLSGPGIGKSHTVKEAHKQIAQTKNRKFVEWNILTREQKVELLKSEEARRKVYVFADARLSQWDAADFALPSFTEGVYERNAPMLFIVFSKPGIAGCFFADELPNATPTVQAAAQQLFLDRAVGEVSLQDEVAILAAGNRGCDRAGVFEVSAPAANRFAHIELQPPTSEDWVNHFALPSGLDERVVAFISWSGDKLNATDKDIKNTNNLAFATPRSWTKAAEMMKGHDNEMAMIVASAWVGEGNARVFKGFLDVVQKIDVDALFKNPKETIRAMNGDTQMLYGMLSAATGRVKEDKRMLKEGLDICCALIDNNMSDWSASLFQMIRHCDLYRDLGMAGFAKEVVKYPDAMRKLKDLMKLLASDIG